MEKERTCECCGEKYVVDSEYFPYYYAPYYYGRDGHDYCLACFLGVGPKDRAEIWARLNTDGREQRVRRRLRRPPASRSR